MHPNGVLNEKVGKYSGMDRFEAREVVLEDLHERKLLEKTEEHSHAVGHCYRCHTVIEPYLSRQWFVKMKPLAKPAIVAVKKGPHLFELCNELPGALDREIGQVEVPAQDQRAI